MRLKNNLKSFARAIGKTIKKINEKIKSENLNEINTIDNKFIEKISDSQYNLLENDFNGYSISEEYKIDVFYRDIKRKYDQLHKNLNYLEQDAYSVGVNEYIKIIPSNNVNFSNHNFFVDYNSKIQGYNDSPSIAYKNLDNYLISGTEPIELSIPNLNLNTKSVKNIYYQYVDNNNIVVNQAQKQFVNSNSFGVMINSGRFPSIDLAPTINLKRNKFWTSYRTINLSPTNIDGKTKYYNKVQIYIKNDVDIDDFYNNLILTYDSNELLISKKKENENIFLEIELKNVSIIDLSYKLIIRYNNESINLLIKYLVEFDDISLITDNNLFENHGDNLYYYKKYISKSGEEITFDINASGVSSTDLIKCSFIYDNYSEEPSYNINYVSENKFRVRIQIPENNVIIKEEGTLNERKISYQKSGIILLFLDTANITGKNSVVSPIHIKYRQNCDDTPESNKNILKFNEGNIFDKNIEFNYINTYINEESGEEVREYVNTIFFNNDGNIYENEYFPNNKNILPRTIGGFTTSLSGPYMINGEGFKNNNDLNKLNPCNREVDRLYSSAYYDNRGDLENYINPYDCNVSTIVEDSSFSISTDILFLKEESFNNIDIYDSNEEKINFIESSSSSSINLMRDKWNEDYSFVFYVVLFSENYNDIDINYFLENINLGSIDCKNVSISCENKFQEKIIKDNDITIKFVKAYINVKKDDNADIGLLPINTSFYFKLRKLKEFHKLLEVNINTLDTTKSEEVDIDNEYEFYFKNNKKNYSLNEKLIFNRTYSIEFTCNICENIKYNGMSGEMFNPLLSNGHVDYDMDILLYKSSGDKKELLSKTKLSTFYSSSISTKVNTYRYYGKRKTKHGIKRRYIYWKANESIDTSQYLLRSIINNGPTHNVFRKNINNVLLSSGDKIIVNIKTSNLSSLFGISSIEIKINEENVNYDSIY